MPFFSLETFHVNIFHDLSWSSQKLKRPARSTGSAKISAAGEAIDEAKLLVQAHKTLLEMQVYLRLALDFKDSFEAQCGVRHLLPSPEPLLYLTLH